MLTKEKAHEFADQWIAAWNDHDLESVLSHYTNDFEMTTPFIASITNESSGTLKGKSNVENYWSQAMKKFPDLKFEMIDVLFSINSITIYYKSVMDKRAVEFFLFNNEGKVYKSIAHYN
jgi:hypothetical protein